LEKYLWMMTKSAVFVKIRRILETSQVLGNT
jgi:hypothetical protein